MVKKRKQYEIKLNSYRGEQTLVITIKKIRRIIFRYDNINHFFKVSAPYHTSQNEIKTLFYEKERQILNLIDIKKPLTQEILYYYGLRYDSYQDMVNDGFVTSRSEFFAKTKKPFLDYLKRRVDVFEAIMEIPIDHKVRVLMMKTRWGTNSLKTRTLTFNHLLIHYHPEIIDAIVIHELAHYFIGGHQKNFYDLVTKYCPNYQKLANNLKRGNYGNV